MKTLFALLLALCLALAAAACAEIAPTQPETDEAHSDTLVAYFSATGNTRGVAEKLAALTGADLYEIVPADPYTGDDLDYGNSQSRTSLEMDDPDARPEIAGEPLDLAGYTTLYLGYPIWLAYHKLIWSFSAGRSSPPTCSCSSRRCITTACPRSSRR